MENHQINAYPKNWLEAVLLLKLRPRESYGYKLLEQLAEFGVDTKQVGTVYRTLRQMEKDNMIKSTWDASESGPARRMYSITEFGEVCLNSRARGLNQCRRNMEAFLQAYYRQSQ